MHSFANIFKIPFELIFMVASWDICLPFADHSVALRILVPLSVGGKEKRVFMEVVKLIKVGVLCLCARKGFHHPRIYTSILLRSLKAIQLRLFLISFRQRVKCTTILIKDVLFFANEIGVLLTSMWSWPVCNFLQKLYVERY